MKNLAAILLPAVACLPLLCSGCNKHIILNREREKLDAERARLIAEADELDKKLATMPDVYNFNLLENQAKELEKKAADLEAEADTKMKKWESIESQFIPLKKQAESYRAKYGN